MDYLVARARALQRPPPGVPELAAVPWLSTSIIAAASVAVEHCYSRWCSASLFWPAIRPTGSLSTAVPTGTRRTAQPALRGRPKCPYGECNLPQRDFCRLDAAGAPVAGYVIAIDTVEAETGDRILVLDEGNSARQVFASKDAPVRPVIVGIIDAVTV